MWPFKKDKTQTLRKNREALLEEARNIQRSGDLKAYAAKMMEVKAIEDEIAALTGAKNNWHP